MFVIEIVQKQSIQIVKLQNKRIHEKPFKEANEVTNESKRCKYKKLRYSLLLIPFDPLE